MVGTVAVTCRSLVFRGVDQGRESFEAGRASVVRAHEVVVALIRGAVVFVAADATVEATLYLLSTRALDYQRRGGRGVAHIPVSVLLVVFEELLAAEQCAAFAFEQMAALSGVVA